MSHGFDGKAGLTNLFLYVSARKSHMDGYLAAWPEAEQVAENQETVSASEALLPVMVFRPFFRVFSKNTLSFFLICEESF